MGGPRASKSKGLHQHGTGILHAGVDVQHFDGTSANCGPVTSKSKVLDQHGSGILHAGVDDEYSDGTSANHSSASSLEETGSLSMSDSDFEDELQFEKNSNLVKVKNTFIEFEDGGEEGEIPFSRQWSAPARSFDIEEGWHEGEQLPARGDLQLRAGCPSPPCCQHKTDSDIEHDYHDKAQAHALGHDTQDVQSQAGKGEGRATSCRDDADAHHVPNDIESQVKMPGMCTLATEVTVMLLNHDTSCTPCGLARVLDASGHRGQYDFIFVATDLPNYSKRRSAIINFVAQPYAEAFIQTHEKLCRAMGSDSMTNVVPASVNGFRDLYKKYVMSSAMKVVPEGFRPLLKREPTRVEMQSILDEGGLHLPCRDPATPHHPPQPSAGAVMPRSGRHPFQPGRKMFCGFCGLPRHDAPTARVCMQCGNPYEVAR